MTIEDKMTTNVSLAHLRTLAISLHYLSRKFADRDMFEKLDAQMLPLNAMDVAVQFWYIAGELNTT